MCRTSYHLIVCAEQVIKLYLNKTNLINNPSFDSSTGKLSSLYDIIICIYHFMNVHYFDSDSDTVIILLVRLCAIFLSIYNFNSN